MADVKPFRAVRYALPTPAVRARPTTCSTRSARTRYRARDPHNVVHLTLNDSEEEAGRLFHEWREDGVARARRRAGRLGGGAGLRRPGRHRAHAARGSSRRCGVEPYETKSRAAARADACRPEGEPAPAPPRGASAARADLPALRRRATRLRPVARPDLAAEGTRLWRIDGRGVAGVVRGPAAPDRRRAPPLRDRGRLRRRGRDAGERPMLVVLVSTSDPGLEIFPTHRVFAGHDDELPRRRGDSASLEAAMAQLDGLPFDSAAAVLYRRGARSGRRPAGRARRRARRPRRPRGHSLHARSRGGGSAASTPARPTARFSCAPRGSRTSSSGRARRGDATEDHVLLPEAPLGLLFHPLTRERLARALPRLRRRHRGVLDGCRPAVEREPVLRHGEGGDDTTAIDAAAEEAVVARLEALDATSCSSRRSSGAGLRRRRPDRGSSSTRSTAR